MHERGLSAPTRANDSDKFTLFDAKVDLIERTDLLVANAVDFADAFEVNEAHGFFFFGGADSGGATIRTSSPSATPDLIST